MSRAQAIWGAVEVSSKILDCADVGTCGMLSVITALEFFQHRFAKMGHRNTSCDPHLHPSHQATNTPLPHAKRPPPGGYVLNGRIVNHQHIVNGTRRIHTVMPQPIRRSSRLSFLAVAFFDPT